MAEWKDKQFNETLKRANESVTKAHEEGAKFERKRIIDKACKQLKTMITEITYHTENSIAEHYDIDEFVEDFKKAMEE